MTLTLITCKEPCHFGPLEKIDFHGIIVSRVEEYNRVGGTKRSLNKHD
jgi:hypothetical protein